MTLFSTGFIAHVVSRLDSDQVSQGLVTEKGEGENPTYVVKVAGLGGSAYRIEGVQYNPIYTEVDISIESSSAGTPSHTHTVAGTITMPVPEVGDNVIIWKPEGNPQGEWMIVGVIRA